jgi:hypothetical protein
MTMNDADEKITLMDAEVSPSRVSICVGIDPRPLMCHIEPKRLTATVLIAIGRDDDRIVRL